MGVNVVGVEKSSQQQQDIIIQQLQKAGVRTVRTGISEKFICFIANAYKHGIGTIAIVYPTQGSVLASQHARPADPPRTTWAVGRLSDADPQGFEQWLIPLLAELQREGVKLTALEIGNEINSSGYNGDFPVPCDGRVLGFDALENGWEAWFHKQPITDPTASNIAKGFYVYLSILDAARKAVHEASPLNAKIPIISAGAVYNTDLPHPAQNPQGNGPSYGVPAADFIRFLRQHGLDDRVDGYGIHIYYSTRNNIEKALSICGSGQHKPCWLTEWGGYPTSGMTCPLGYGAGDDAANIQHVADVREAVRPFVNRGLLVTTMYYSWNSGGNIYIPACNGVTKSGLLALAPFD